MQFIKGTPMNRAMGTRKLVPTSNTAYVNPRAIESAIYDPSEDVTIIRFPGENGGSVGLKGNVMADYEERLRRQGDDGSED
ncbi:MAG: hypothetical protein IJG86_01920 [Clostridia bacterium]|nr:hypothetical protein [Clostridia bacterium]